MRTDHQPTRRPDQEGDYQATGLTIAQAASRLGVSENAVRQRIKRGTLDATKVDGVWRVALPPADYQADYQTDHESATSGDSQADHEPTRLAVSPQAVAQLEAIRDEWLRPLMERNEELARELGRVEQERDSLRRELTQARATLEAAVAPSVAQDAPGTPSVDDEGLEPWPRRWWRGLAERLYTR